VDILITVFSLPNPIWDNIVKDALEYIILSFCKQI